MYEALVGHARHSSETRTVGAQSVLNTCILQCGCSYWSSCSVQFSSCAVNSAVGKHRIFCHSAVLYGRIFRAIRRRERRTKSMAAPSVASSAAAARRLSCVGGSTTLHPPPPSAIAPTAPRSVCPLEEPTVDRCRAPSRRPRLGQSVPSRSRPSTGRTAARAWSSTHRGLPRPVRLPTSTTM